MIHAIKSAIRIKDPKNFQKYLHCSLELSLVTSAITMEDSRANTTINKK
jgi:hypothetical protein